MKRCLWIILMFGVLATPARAAQSANVEHVAQLPEAASAISANFIGDTMFVSAVTGLFAYDIADPERPRLLGTLPMYIYENEDVDVDRARERLFISRDPRGFTSPAAPGNAFPFGQVQIIDVSDPASMREIHSFLLPAGHTTTCVNDCDTLWTAGPGANPVSNPGLVGRPIYATDVRDPQSPVPCPDPIATDIDDGESGYVHDVQVDGRGVAWVSGQGGVRGYWTSGRHRDPSTGKPAVATGCDPIPYAGAGSPEVATPSRFMHNSFRDWRPMASARKRRIRARGGVPRNALLLATEENLTSDCAASGRFAAYDLRGTRNGQGFRDPGTRLRPLDTWTPEGAEGASGCDSAHYFTTRRDGLTVNAFYGQGVRFLDTSDPRDIRQVGYFVNPDSNTFAAAFRDGYVYVTDIARGVDVLRFEGSAAGARTVTAPAAGRSRTPLRFARSDFGGLCPLELPAR